MDFSILKHPFSITNRLFYNNEILNLHINPNLLQNTNCFS